MGSLLSSFLILFVLTIGYHYVSSSPIQKMTLKKGTNQEIYALIVMHGMIFLYKGVARTIKYFAIISLIFASFIICIYMVMSYTDIGAKVSTCIAKNLSYLTQFPYILSSMFGMDNNALLLKIILFEFLANSIFDAISACRNEISSEKDSNRDYKFLFEKVKERVDSLILFLLESIDKKKLVKVSLTSGRFYIGIVEIKKLSRLDLSYISIIPFKSGYRREDQTLSFNGSFIPLYEEKEILKWENNKYKINNPERLEEFQYVLPIKDIQSISYFDNDTHNYIIKSS